MTSLNARKFVGMADFPVRTSVMTVIKSMVMGAAPSAKLSMGLDAQIYLINQAFARRMFSRLFK